MKKLTSYFYLLLIPIIFIFSSRFVFAEVCSELNPDWCHYCEFLDVGHGDYYFSLGDFLTKVIRIIAISIGGFYLLSILAGFIFTIKAKRDQKAQTNAQWMIHDAAKKGMIILAVLISIIFFEQVLTRTNICLGISCDLNIPDIIETPIINNNVCVCSDRRTLIDVSKGEVCPDRFKPKL